MGKDKRPFVQMDQGYFTNPKIAPLLDESHAAVCLHFASICYAAQHMTDGVVPVKTLLRLTGATGHDAALLYAEGLWVELPGGKEAEVHDFLDHQTSRADRERSVEAGRRGAEKRWGKRSDSPAYRDSDSPPFANPNAEEKRREEKFSPRRASAPRRPTSDLPQDDDLRWVHSHIDGGLGRAEEIKALGMFADKGYDREHVRNIIRSQRQENHA
jgi:hypothetical protein